MSGIVEIDIHGLNRFQAQTCIDGSLRRAGSGVYRIRIIHGFHGGTVLRDMIRRVYTAHSKVLRVEMGMNPGETDLVLREFA